MRKEADIKSSKKEQFFVALYMIRIDQLFLLYISFLIILIFTRFDDGFAEIVDFVSVEIVKCWKSCE